MMDFQREPEPARCDKCHKVLVTELTSESDPYCTACGHVVGTSVQPAIWACDQCGDTFPDWKSRENHVAPVCDDCQQPMSCVKAWPSKIHGAETGDADLDLGLELLRDAQKQHPCESCENRNTAYCAGSSDCDKLREWQLKHRNTQK